MSKNKRPNMKCYASKLKGRHSSHTRACSVMQNKYEESCVYSVEMKFCIVRSTSVGVPATQANVLFKGNTPKLEPI